MENCITAPEFRSAMQRFPGVVTIVTAAEDGQRLGITVSAISSVTDEPPTLLVCLNHATGTCAMVEHTRRFNVNLLSRGDGDLAMRFAGADGVTGAEKFLRGAWVPDERGTPYLPSAIVSFSCDVVQSLEVGTHRVFIGQIKRVRQSEGEPLLYEQASFRKTAHIEPEV